MIASVRGVAIAAAIAILLAIALVVDLGGTPVPTSRALVPAFDPERVTQLIWERAGQPTIDVVRAETGWQLRSPSTAPAEPRAISDVLAALRGARWHRRGEPTPTRASLTVVSGSERRSLGIGEAIAGTDQVWIVDGDRGLVVDSWVARALDRDLLSLRIRAPLAEVRSARTIVVETAGAQGDAADRIALRLEGSPRRLVRPVQLLVAAELADELERALGELTVARLAAGPAAARGLAIAIAGASSAPGAITIELGGSCPGAPELVAMSGSTGDGCVERAVATSIEQAIARLRQPHERTIERRPVPFEPQRIALADGIALDVSRMRVGDHAADQARVAELVAALAAPAEAAPLPRGPASQHMQITDRRGETIALDLFSERVVARRGEPIALRPAQGAWQLLVRRSRELRDVALWLEEPTAITSVRIDHVSYVRGAVIGAWTREPAGPVDSAAVEALVAQLAAPRATGFIDGPFATAHRVMIAITPPIGSPSERMLEIGRPRRDGCAARVGHESVFLSAMLCAQIAALAR